MNFTRKAKILTDISIPQNWLWQEETENIKEKVKINLSVIPNSSILLGLLIFLKRKKYDIIITANLKTGFILGLLQYLFRKKSCKHICLEMMLDEERSSFSWLVKRFLQRKAFSKMDCIFVSSRSEIQTYSRRLDINPEKFHFLPFHTNIVDPKPSEEKEDYILSAGRTERDYPTLIQAIKGLEIKLVIVADDHSLKKIKGASGVKILKDLPYPEYLELLKRAKAVVLPLNPVSKSTGQVVMLEAMALGKPVISSKVTGTLDYIEDGVNGLLVNPKDPTDLRNKLIWLLNKPDKAEQIGEKGFLFVKKHLTFDNYVAKVLKTAYSLIS
ncbi:MAG: glycosyltransferase family 4 protein [Candidatus Zixiibacteriota bacterium]